MSTTTAWVNLLCRYSTSIGALIASISFANTNWGLNKPYKYTYTGIQTNGQKTYLRDTLLILQQIGMSNPTSQNLQTIITNGSATYVEPVRVRGGVNPKGSGPVVYTTKTMQLDAVDLEVVVLLSNAGPILMLYENLYTARRIRSNGGQFGFNATSLINFSGTALPNKFYSMQDALETAILLN